MNEPIYPELLLLLLLLLESLSPVLSPLLPYGVRRAPGRRGSGRHTEHGCAGSRAGLEGRAREVRLPHLARLTRVPAKLPLVRPFFVTVLT